MAGMVVGCGTEPPTADTIPGRWYTVEHVAKGGPLYLHHCASCHGESAAGTREWRTIDADGHYPPPPLDGTAHTWHHPLAMLEQTIAEGGVALGGVMPGFAATLSEAETRAMIAYFQNFWPDDIYNRWQEINNR